MSIGHLIKKLAKLRRCISQIHLMQIFLSTEPSLTKKKRSEFDSDAFFRSMAKALPMVKEMISKLIESSSKIPTWVLTSFNDPVVKFRKKTRDVKELRSSLNRLRYGGGGNLEEQAFRGAIYLEFEPGT